MNYAIRPYYALPFPTRKHPCSRPRIPVVGRGPLGPEPPD